MNQSEPAFRFNDELGPKAILYVHDPKAGLRGIVVVDNVAAGPAIGGIRMAVDVSLEECFRLARAMTFKNAAAGLAHGGGKSVIFGDPAMDRNGKERLLRAFARAIRTLTDYIPGPDMGTDETAMAWILDEIGRCVGLPRELGGVPLDEIGATGYGVTVAAEVAARSAGLDLAGARVAIQGFGAVGRHAARFLAGKGAVVVAAADSTATVSATAGLDVEALLAHKTGGGLLAEYPGAERSPREAVIAAECDILVPAARPDAVTARNAGDVQARLIVPGANIGVTDEAEALLHERGVLCLPDFIANAGGVICAAVEYHGGTQAQAMQTIAERIKANTEEVLQRASAERVRPRQAAETLAGDRVRSAMAWRR